MPDHKKHLLLKAIRSGQRAFILLGGVVMFGLLPAISPSRASEAITIGINGLEDAQYKDLRSYLDQTIRPRYDSTSLSQLNIEALRQDMRDALYAKGFYAAEVLARQDGTKVELAVTPRSLYTIGRVVITGSPVAVDLPDLETGDSLDAQKVLSAQSALYSQIAKDRCLYSLSVTHEVTLDLSTHKGTVHFVVDAGPPVAFGTTTFSGAPSIDRDYLSHFITYKDGDCWDAQKIERSKTALLENGLLSVVQVQYPATPPKANSTINLVYDLKERAPRSIRIGGSYYTDEGVGVVAKWEHRNFFGAGEHVITDLSLSPVRQSAGVNISKPYFLRDDQSLGVDLQLKNEESDAFIETGLASSVSLNRKITPHLNASAGIGADISRLDDKNTDETHLYTLVSGPMGLVYDNRDHILDPHHGWTGNLLVEPFLDASGESSPFVKTRLTTASYIRLSSEDSGNGPVLALRGSVGSILGSGTDTIPASKRFFAGGGNSIRGFGYQKVGPYDEDGNPTGGRSLIETSAELRLKFSSTLGGVAFVDAGNVYDAVVPDLKGGLYMAAGAGVRYYTDFAPIRFDIAVPLNKKENLDQNFQIYISIGQAF